MTPKRYHKILELVGLSQVGAGRFLEVDPRQSRRFASGQRPIPAPIAMLLEIMKAEGIAPNEARKLAGLPLIEGLNRPAGRPVSKL